MVNPQARGCLRIFFAKNLVVSGESSIFAGVTLKLYVVEKENRRFGVPADIGSTDGECGGEPSAV